MTPKKMRSQACTVPIQEMAEGVEVERRVER
jgi:hypothetical protein